MSDHLMRHSEFLALLDKSAEDCRETAKKEQEFYLFAVMLEGLSKRFREMTNAPTDLGEIDAGSDTEVSLRWYSKEDSHSPTKPEDCFCPICGAAESELDDFTCEEYLARKKAKSLQISEVCNLLREEAETRTKMAEDHPLGAPPSGFAQAAFDRAETLRTAANILEGVNAG